MYLFRPMRACNNTNYQPDSFQPYVIMSGVELLPNVIPSLSHINSQEDDLTSLRARSAMHATHSLRTFQHTQIIHPIQILKTRQPGLRAHQPLIQHREAKLPAIDQRRMVLQRRARPVPRHGSIQAGPRQRKHAARDLLRLSLRQARRLPHVAELLHAAQAQADAVACAVPLRAVQDVAACGEVGERGRREAADAHRGVLQDRDGQGVEVDGALGGLERFLGVSPVGSVFVARDGVGCGRWYAVSDGFSGGAVEAGERAVDVDQKSAFVSLGCIHFKEVGGIAGGRHTVGASYGLGRGAHRPPHSCQQRPAFHEAGASASSRALHLHSPRLLPSFFHHHHRDHGDQGESRRFLRGLSGT